MTNKQGCLAVSHPRATPGVDSVRWLAWKCAAWCVGLLWLGTPAIGAAEQNKASTNRATREEAIRAIPFGKLDKSAQAKARRVLADTTVFRRLPLQSIECDADFYRYLVEHPDVVVETWRAMGISEVALSRDEDDMYTADDSAGTVGKLQFLYKGNGLHILYGEGKYAGQLFAREIRGSCLLVLKSSFSTGENGESLVTCRMDAFVSVENIGIEVLAKTFQPIVGKAADHNLRETAQFVANLNQAATDNQAGIDRLVAKMTSISEEDRQEFKDASQRVAVQASIRKAEMAKQNARPTRPTATANRRPSQRQPTRQTQRQAPRGRSRSGQRSGTPR